MEEPSTLDAARLVEAQHLGTASLDDPWDASGSIALDGYLEREKFGPGLTVFLTLILVIVLFHLVIGPIAMVTLLFLNGVTLADLQGSLETVIADHARTLLVANTIGQVFALAMPTYLILRLHTGRPWAFIRFRKTTWPTVGLAVVGLIGLTPLVWWLGALNEAIPLPEWVQKLEKSQVDLIEQVLMQDLGVAFSLFVMALTPAICEEILFRGYVQRQIERSVGVAGAVVLVGVIFGLFHFRLSQFIPLSIIGIYLAYLTWRTGSLWPAIVVHFANNASALLMGMYVSRQPGMSLESLDRIDVPPIVTVLGAALVAAAMYLLNQNGRRLMAADSPPSTRN